MASAPPLPELDFDAMSAEDVLGWAYAEFGDRLCLTCSWQKQSSVLVHMVSELGLDLPVIELDTHLFFRESYETRDRLPPRPAAGAHRPPPLTAPGAPPAAPAADHGGGAAPPGRPEPLGDRPRQLLPRAQGRAAPQRARALRSLDLRDPPRPVAEPRDHAEGAVVGALRRLEGAPAGRLGREARLGLHPGQRNSVQPPPRRRLPLDRVHPVHAADEPRGRGARRPLGRLRQAGMRHPSRHPRRRHMTDHIYAAEHPETTHVRPGGFTLWFTGLSGSGKTTIAHLVGPELDRRGLVVEYLDGDTVRTHLSKGLGFSKEDRDTHIKRVGWVASRLTRQGGAVIAATISPYEATRQEARANIDEVGTFVEIYVKTSVDECARRDVKGLYEKAFKGEIKEFTGVSDPYEEPTNPELVIDTESHEPEESAALVVAKLEELGLVPAQVTA